MDRQNLKKCLLSPLNPQLQFQNPKLVKVKFQKRSQFKGEIPNRSVTLKFPKKTQLKIFSPPLTTYQTQSYEKFRKNINNWKKIQNPNILQLRKKSSMIPQSDKHIQNVQKLSHLQQNQLDFSCKNCSVEKIKEGQHQVQEKFLFTNTFKKVGKIVQKPIKKRRNSLSNLIQARVLQRKKSMSQYQINNFLKQKKVIPRNCSLNIEDIGIQTQKHTIQENHYQVLSRKFSQSNFQNYPKSEDPFQELQTCIKTVQKMSDKIQQLRRSIGKNLQRSQSVMRSTSAVSIKYQQDLYSTKYDSPSNFIKTDSRFYQDKRQLLKSTNLSHSQNGSYLKSLQKRFGDLSNFQNLSKLAKATSSSYINEADSSRKSIVFDSLSTFANK